MKLQATLAGITFALLSSTSFAANVIPNYEMAVGAEVIVRQVLTQNLLKNSDSVFNQQLKNALEGSGRSPERSTINSLVCDRALGSDICIITIVISNENSKDDDGSASFNLRTTIRKGKVTSAAIEGFIG